MTRDWTRCWRKARGASAPAPPEGEDVPFGGRGSPYADVGRYGGHLLRRDDRCVTRIDFTDRPVIACSYDC
jgi:hypothetical protein